MMRKKYTPPPDAVFNAGRRKARTTTCIRYIKAEISQCDNPVHRLWLDNALENLTHYQKALLKI